MRRSTYKNVSSFGTSVNKDLTSNPLTFCLNTEMDQLFMHGSSANTLGPNSKACQSYLAAYCAEKWDGFCETASKDTSVYFPNNLLQAGRSIGNSALLGLSAGDILIRNTASEKYLVNMGNCVKKYQPFDPTVASSPMISYWESAGVDGASCVPTYAVNPATVDQDVVMDKIIARPIIAMDIILNIFNTMKNNGTLEQLRNTKLGRFYATNPYCKQNGCTF